MRAAPSNAPGKRPRPKKPIMSADEERFMAFNGLVQWTQAAIMQSATVSAARARQLSVETMQDGKARHLAVLAFHSECHFFAIAAHKIFEYRAWARSFGIFASVDFSELDQFDAATIRDLRNMREHVVDYFKGEGCVPERWVIETPEYKADASTVVETRIGGRLDWVKFGAAAELLLPRLLRGADPFSALDEVSLDEHKPEPSEC